LGGFTAAPLRRTATSNKTHLQPFLEPKCNAAEGYDLAARDQAVLEHLHLVKATANSIRNGLPIHAERDDLMQAGVLGLIDAANKFDSNKQTSFSTYAKHRIRGAILDSLRKLDWASRDMRRRQKVVAAVVEQLTATLERTPSEAEVADKAGMDLRACRHAMTDLHNGGPVSSSSFTNDNQDFPAPDFAGGPETHPDFISEREQLRGFLAEVVKTLPEKYQKVVAMYYTNDMSMKEIGSALSINESRVSQIHKSALARMAAVLEARGIASHQAFID